jgi:hypothetical protein
MTHHLHWGILTAYQCVCAPYSRQMKAIEWFDLIWIAGAFVCLFFKITFPAFRDVYIYRIRTGGETALRNQKLLY